jgi:hypothetical protein
MRSFFPSRATRESSQNPLRDKMGRAGDRAMALHHAMNHVRFMISPELHVVQDRVQDKP